MWTPANVQKFLATGVKEWSFRGVPWSENHAIVVKPWIAPKDLMNDTTAVFTLDYFDSTQSTAVLRPIVANKEVPPTPWGMVQGFAVRSAKGESVAPPSGDAKSVSAYYLLDTHVATKGGAVHVCVWGGASQALRGLEPSPEGAKV